MTESSTREATRPVVPIDATPQKPLPPPAGELERLKAANSDLVDQLAVARYEACTAKAKLAALQRIAAGRANPPNA